MGNNALTDSYCIILVQYIAYISSFLQQRCIYSFEGVDVIVEHYSTVTIVPQGYIGKLLLYHRDTLTYISDFVFGKVTPPHRKKPFVDCCADPSDNIYNPQQTTERYKNCV